MSNEWWAMSSELFRQKNKRTCFLFSGHRPLCSKTANNIFAVTERWAVSGEGVGTLCAASEEYTRVIISRESHESRKMLLYAFGGICVSKKLRTLHATSLHLTAHGSPFNNGTQMTQMRQITADLIFWQRNKRTYFSFDSSVLMSNLIAHNSLLKMFLCLILLAWFAWFAGVKTSDAARRRPYFLTAHGSSLIAHLLFVKKQEKGILGWGKKIRECSTFL